MIHRPILRDIISLLKKYNILKAETKQRLNNAENSKLNCLINHKCGAVRESHSILPQTYNQMLHACVVAAIVGIHTQFNS